jgi:hypothetical protein
MASSSSAGTAWQTNQYQATFGGNPLPPTTSVPQAWADRERDRAAEPAPPTGPPCKNCGAPTIIVTSQSAANMGRPFWGCPNYKSDEACKGFKGWVGEEGKAKAAYAATAGQKNNSLTEFMLSTNNKLNIIYESLTRIEAALQPGACGAARPR